MTEDGLWLLTVGQSIYYIDNGNDVCGQYRFVISNLV